MGLCVQIGILDCQREDIQIMIGRLGSARAEVGDRGNEKNQLEIEIQLYILVDDISWYQLDQHINSLL